MPTASDGHGGLTMSAIGRMTAMEIMHLRLNHVVSYDKIATLSNSGARGIQQGLKAPPVKCNVCQHANCKRSPAAPAATGSDPFDMSFDLVDMSTIPTIGGKRYCTIFIIRKTRFAFTFLHERKTEFPGILDKLLAQFSNDDRPKILKCDGAGEYDSREFHDVIAKYPGTRLQLSNAHEQSANGMVEKMVDRLGRMLRATLLQSQMPPEFWGAATILLTDIYNCTPHAALDNETPYLHTLDPFRYVLYGCIRHVVVQGQCFKLRIVIQIPTNTLIDRVKWEVCFIKLGVNGSVHTIRSRAVCNEGATAVCHATP